MPEPSWSEEFWGSTTLTLRELLEEVFEDNIQMAEPGFFADGDPFTGENALTVHSRIFGDEDLPLHRAAANGSAHGVRLLLEAGADPNAKGDLSLSPLYYAIRHDHFEVAQLLLDAGARVDVVNELGCSDLGKCSPRGTSPNPKMFRLLQSRWPGVKPKI